MDDYLSPEAAELTISGETLSGAAFIIPLDAPLPNELVGSDVPTGSLLNRLRYLADGDVPTGYAFVPISGAEFLTLERAWVSLQERKRIFVLTELPGARYDVLFDQARRAIGLRALDWPSISTAMAAHVIEAQRTRDTRPWQDGPPSTGGRSRFDDNAQDLPLPAAEGDDNAD